MEFRSVLTKEQSYSFPPSTTFPEQLKFSLCFRPICKSRYCLFSKTFPSDLVLICDGAVAMVVVVVVVVVVVTVIDDSPVVAVVTV